MTLNGGMEMNSWFDITGLTADSAEDTGGILSRSASTENPTSTWHHEHHS